MNDEPQLTEISDEDNQPATKGDVKTVANEIRSEMPDMKDEIIREFKVVAENIHQDVAGTNADEVSFIKDQQIPELKQRVDELEQVTGLAP